MVELEGSVLKALNDSHDGRIRRTSWSPKFHIKWDWDHEMWVGSNGKQYIMGPDKLKMRGWEPYTPPICPCCGGTGLAS